MALNLAQNSLAFIRYHELDHQVRVLMTIPFNLAAPTTKEERTTTYLVQIVGYFDNPETDLDLGTVFAIDQKWVATTAALLPASEDPSLIIADYDT